MAGPIKGARPINIPENTTPGEYLGNILLAYIRANPGTTMNQVRLNMSRKNLKIAQQWLIEQGLITVEPQDPF